MSAGYGDWISLGCLPATLTGGKPAVFGLFTESGFVLATLTGGNPDTCRLCCIEDKLARMLARITLS